MARSNKYTSINLNDVFEKKLNNNSNKQSTTTNNSSAKSFPNQSKTVLSNSRIHGHMLVLTRPTPKPISVPQKPQDKSPSVVPAASAPDQSKGGVPEPVSISLRPQGRTGSGPALASSPLPSPVSPLPPPPVKSDRFVPPHLRPGFVGKEEKPGSDLGKGGAGSFKGKPEVRPPHRSGPHHGLDPIERRPKSGGGYEHLTDLNRPGSSGTRPSSSG
ncbi:uncharacterized protein LOC127254213 [Andrographis paniculata]|uniref:uncharacterized protein LOC127254213 n=1 Tax=Andrographis paniculata TaxID=175694 RepID=UPI0021E7289A|nr:uncharacterized protein LOC127254213 [Andrographis paniculata]XP_051135141.1 uncharacterized protein LOC127254213 [Andrographis paniculata]